MLLNRLRTKYEKYENLAPASFFVLGFLVDLISMGRIDSVWNTRKSSNSLPAFESTTL